MKRFLIILAAVLMTALQANAVLKEKNLSRTIGVLKLELRNNHIKQRAMMERMVTQQEMVHNRLVDYMQRSEQISLMLYSQKADFTFDIAYACQQATSLYQEMNSTNIPYDRIKADILQEVARYDSLIYSLEQLPPAIGKAKKSNAVIDSLILNNVSDTTEVDSTIEGETDIYILTEQEQADRDTCIIHAKSLRNNLLRILNALSKDKEHYTLVNDRVSKLNRYAMFRYKKLQDKIFKTGGDNYFKILMTLPRQWERAMMDFSDKYKPLSHSDRKLSQWRGPQVIFVSFAMVFYLIITYIISNVILRWVLPRSIRIRENYRKKRPAFIMSLGILLFSIALICIKNVFIDNSLITMSATLMLNMTWLMQVVQLSLIIRLNNEQIKYGVNMYLPFMVMAFLVILFRIVLIPNNILNIVFPLILLIFTFWQIIVARNTRRHVPISDKFYNAISLFTITASLVVAWCGYTLLAVQITIWWTFQLAAIQTITCLYDIMEMVENKYILHRIRRLYSKENPDIMNVSDETVQKSMHNGDYVTVTWFYDLVNRAIVPILAVVSVLMSIAFAADTFEMRESCVTIFYTDFISIEGVIQVSLFKICLVVSCYFLFAYINYTIRSFYFNYKKMLNENTRTMNKTLAKNVIAIIVWGIYIVFAMVLLQVPKSGIEVVTAGLATGMGFAMKDLLENFFYGISLMTGRLRVGDYIECDGVQGKVESITYQSTQILAIDGSVIAFLNSSLFNKNFKNLTRNHQYELIKIPVGVAYGTDINKVRKLILDGIKPLATKTDDGRDIVDPIKGQSVVFADFGASSVDLSVMQWILVDQKYAYQAKAKETIYNILNDNHIEIPFPQQDIYIRKITGDAETLNATLE